MLADCERTQSSNPAKFKTRILNQLERIAGNDPSRDEKLQQRDEKEKSGRFSRVVTLHNNFRFSCDRINQLRGFIVDMLRDLNFDR